MSNRQSYTRYEVSSGTFSASYPDNSHVIINDNAQVNFSFLTIGAGSVMIIGKFASATITSLEPVTVGDNSQIILQPGSKLTIESGSSMQLSKSCLLDLSLGKLEMLNDLAPFLSCGGTIKSRFGINSLCATQRTINKRHISMRPNRNER